MKRATYTHQMARPNIAYPLRERLRVTLGWLIATTVVMAFLVLFAFAGFERPA